MVVNYTYTGNASNYMSLFRTESVESSGSFVASSFDEAYVEAVTRLNEHACQQMPGRNRKVAYSLDSLTAEGEVVSLKGRTVAFSVNPILNFIFIFDCRL